MLKYIIVLLVLCTTTAQAKKLNVEVDGDECRLIEIRYDDINNMVYAVGNCQIFYEMCDKDFCKVIKMEPKELDFGNANNIGLQYDND